MSRLKLIKLYLEQQQKTKNREIIIKKQKKSSQSQQTIGKNSIKILEITKKICTSTQLNIYSFIFTHKKKDIVVMDFDICCFKLWLRTWDPTRAQHWQRSMKKKHTGDWVSRNAQYVRMDYFDLNVFSFFLSFVLLEFEQQWSHRSSASVQELFSLEPKTKHLFRKCLMPVPILSADHYRSSWMLLVK